MRASDLLRFASLVLLSATTAAGCIVEEERPARGGSGVVPPVETDPVDFGGPTGACTPGAVASCTITLATHGDVEHCVTAEKVCLEDGQWGACGEVPESFPADGHAPADDMEGMGGGIPS